MPAATRQAWRAIAPSLLKRLRENLGPARLDRREIAGSLGDLGTFLPLLVAMVSLNGLNLASALFFAGLFNIVTGLIFTVPMAVQPMKAIAAVALTEGLSVGQILAAGATVGLIVLTLGVTGMIEKINRLVPRSVVRGLQLALGLSLLLKGAQMALGTGATWGPDSHATAAIAAIIVLALLWYRRVPAALVLFLFGVGLAIWKNPSVGESLRLSLTLPRWSPPAWADFVSAFPKASLPQIPLTTLNSVIAVCALSTSLFPNEHVRPKIVAISVGMMNLTSVWFGGMPMCHGAGGLAGQYRFGARTNGSILFLGSAKMAAAILFGASLMALCIALPSSVLGVMLCVSGIELTRVARDQRRGTDIAVMFLTAAAILDLHNITLGLAMGLAMGLTVRLPKWASSRWAHRASSGQ